MSAVVLFVLFFVILLFGLPISVTMGISSILPWVVDNTFAANLVMVLRQMMSGVNSLTLLAIPMFMLSGTIMARGGISKKLFDVFTYFVGNVIGGVPCAVIITCLFYGAISGSGPATTAAVGAMCVPFLTELGYDKTWSAGLVAVAGGLGVIIPPSIPFVLYSLATGVSTGKLFLAGIIPGLLVGLALMVYAVIHCLRNGEDKDKVRERMEELSRMGFLQLFRDSSWALLCPVIVLGGIYTGFTTPTEAAAVSVFYALLVSLFVYKTMNFGDILPMLRESVRTYGGLAFVLAFATAFGRVLSMTRATKAVESFILGNFTSGVAVLTVLVLIFLVLGMVMDTGPAIIILVPVLLPACKKLGVDPIHLGVVLVCCLSIGLATPPFGLDLFVAGNIAEQQPMSVARKSVPFICAFLAALVGITYIPALSTFLPALW